MDRWKKLLEEFSLKSDLMITLMGISLIISLLFIFQDPGNDTAVLAAALSGGCIYLLNGLKLWKDPKKKMTGYSYLMMGIIVILFGFFFKSIISNK
jgi:hypothetical protein